MGSTRYDGVDVTTSSTPLSSATPAMNGTAAAGVQGTAARGDHVHPSDTSRVPTTRQVTAGNGLTGGGALSADVNLAVSYYSATPTMAGVGSPGVSNLPARGDHVHPADTSRVPSTRQVIAGSGLSGGGALSSDVTLSMSLSTATPALVTDQLGSAGASNSPARGDHTHQLPLRTVIVPLPLTLVAQRLTEGGYLWAPYASSPSYSDDALQFNPSIDPATINTSSMPWARWPIPTPAGLANITSIRVILQPASGHTTWGFYTPFLCLARVRRSGLTTTTTFLQGGPDSSTSIAEYETVHEIVVDTSPSTLLAGDKYFVHLIGEYDVGSKTGLKVLWAEATLSVRG